MYYTAYCVVLRYNLSLMSYTVKKMTITSTYITSYLYFSRASSIFRAVTLPSSTLISISAAVFLVVSKLITSAESLRMSGPAEDNRFSKSSSRLFSVILKSFCIFVRPARKASKSGLSALTTSPSSCSSKLNC